MQAPMLDGRGFIARLGGALKGDNFQNDIQE